MFYLALVVVHLIVCSILVAVVLLQSVKGAELGATFGGSSQTLFGGRGAATFLSKVTVTAAVLFMSTSLGLSVLSRERSVASSVMSKKAAGDVVPKEGGVPTGREKLPATPNPTTALPTSGAPPAPSDHPAPAVPSNQSAPPVSGSK